MRDLIRNLEVNRESVEINISDTSKVILPVYVSEYWTSKQRAGHSLHEVPYRACFKPQLPKFFIERLSQEGDVVYDPFMGRGTTILEAALLNRRIIGGDINPVCHVLAQGRINPPTLKQIEARLKEIKFEGVAVASDDPLLTFYHPDTLANLYFLRDFLTDSRVDLWIKMVALTRLSGHSSSEKPDSGYFSVYTLPPNQAASIKSQKKINEKRNQRPVKKDLKKIILKKSKSLLRNLSENERNFLDKDSIFITGDCRKTKDLDNNIIDLIVTSPPFLDIVDYKKDNWLRFWFLGVDPNEIQVSILKKIEDWRNFITECFLEFKRILKPSGHICFEVGEVKGINLDEEVVKCSIAAGLKPTSILINQQNFTKTSNIWGVDNNKKGTNTNRIVIIKKDEDWDG